MLAQIFSIKSTYLKGNILTLREGLDRAKFRTKNRSSVALNFHTGHIYSPRKQWGCEYRPEILRHLRLWPHMVEIVLVHQQYVIDVRKHRKRYVINEFYLILSQADPLS